MKEFFRTYYAPNNATIVVAGAVKADSVKQRVRQLFADIPRGPTIARNTPPAFAVKDTFIVAEDRVQLPRMYLTWHAVKKFDADDAALDAAGYLLAGARNSRLTNTMVYEQELTGDVVGVQRQQEARRGLHHPRHGASRQVARLGARRRRSRAAPARRMKGRRRASWSRGRTPLSRCS